MVKKQAKKVRTISDYVGSFYKTTDTTQYKGVTGHNIRSSIQGDKKEKQFSPFLGELRLVRTNPNGSFFANHTSKANARVLQVIEFTNSSCYDYNGLGLSAETMLVFYT